MKPYTCRDHPGSNPITYIQPLCIHCISKLTLGEYSTFSFKIAASPSEQLNNRITIYFYRGHNQQVPVIVIVFVLFTKYSVLLIAHQPDNVGISSVDSEFTVAAITDPIESDSVLV